MPQRGGVLGGGDGDRDPAGRCVHAGLRLLQRDRRDARSPGPLGAGAGGERGGGALLAARGRHLRHPRRSPRRRGGAFRRRRPGPAAESAGGHGRTAGSGLRRKRRRASVRRRRRPRHPRPQRGDRPAPLPGGPEGCGVRPFARPSPPRRRDASLPSAQIRDHGRVRGDRRGSGGGLPGPLRRGVPLAHGGAVSPSLQGSPAVGGIRDAGDGSTPSRRRRAGSASRASCRAPSSEAPTIGRGDLPCEASCTWTSMRSTPRSRSSIARSSAGSR